MSNGGHPKPQKPKRTKRLAKTKKVRPNGLGKR
jgi:hypothetical protein